MPGRPDQVPFQYTIVRVVPRVERGECLNAGVVVLCRERAFLGARTGLDPDRLAALDPDADPATIRAHLVAIERIAAGDPAGGPIASLAAGDRFHWLAAPSSTIIQASAVHAGLADDPAGRLDQLFDALVATPSRAATSAVRPSRS